MELRRAPLVSSTLSQILPPLRRWPPRAAGLFIVASLLMLTTGCPQRVATWIAPGSTPQDLVFLLGAKHGRQSDIATWRVSVYACSDSTPNRLGRAMWDANRVGADRAALLNSVHYGNPPTGFQTLVSAQPLVPGCYVAAVGQEIRFIVLPDGSIHDRGPAWAGSSIDR
jgi:hypothetical protein